MIQNDSTKRRDGNKHEGSPNAKRHKDTYDPDLEGSCEAWPAEETNIQTCGGLEESRIMLIESIGEKEVMRLERLVDEWVAEVKAVGFEEEESSIAYDDVSGMIMPPDKVRAARLEEVGFM